MIEAKFGYYPRVLDLTVGGIEIHTLPGLDKAVALVGAEGVVSDWVYAPPQEVRSFGRGIKTLPYPSRVFGLPKTHLLRHASADTEDHLIFLVWALSFFAGMRLTTTEAGYVDATPIVPGKLVDFVMSPSDLAKCVALADAFWIRNRSDLLRPKRLAAAVHALFLGQNPVLLQFERFILLYMALDACFALAESLHSTSARLSHSRRIAWMCELFGMATPAWADHQAGGKADVAVLRNNTLHEALFVGEPLGFAARGAGTNQNLTLEMQALVCRLLIALIGAPLSDYVRTPVDTRQYHGLTL